MASGVVRNDESASLLDDDDWSPVSAGVSPPPPPPSPLNGKAMRRPRHVVMRLIRSPFAAVFRMTCARAAISTGDEQPSNGDTARVERRREARRRPSLEQLLRMEAASPLPPSRPDRKSKPDTAPSYEVSTCTVKREKRAQEPLSSPSKGHHTVVISDDEWHAAVVPVKFDAGRRTNAKRLVVVFASLRACSRAPGIDVVGMSKGPNGKVAAAGRAPGKAELFYSRPIPMGRRCRVQHLEETPYK